MQPLDAGDASLINDAQFLEELEHFEELGADAAEPVVPSHEPLEYGDALDALESGLPMQPAVPQARLAHHERAPIHEPYRLDDAPPPRPMVETGIPFTTAAIVIVACLTAGAASAALVFHDRVAQITAARTASR